ncbi:MAG: hypothetical protein M3Q91_18755, partial [Acidobacteriota bacterium]|nr:hypothetical protein [Acidobacteriota bacterium]
LALAFTLSSFAFPAAQAAKKKKACATTLANCPREGCASGDAKLNVLKNLKKKPTNAEAEEMTIADVIFLNASTPTKWKSGQDRQAVTDLGEGKGVRIKGYLINAHQTGGTETCNCHLVGLANNDFHLNFVQEQPTSPPAGSTKKAIIAAKQPLMKSSMVIEMSPRSRNKRWSLPRLQALSDGFNYVRVTGWLMFDSQHPSFSHLPRASAWEIHPVTKFEVCTQTVAECDAGTGWKTLETLQ